MNLNRALLSRFCRVSSFIGAILMKGDERENSNLPLRDYSVTYRPDLYPRGVYVRPQKLICKP